MLKWPIKNKPGDISVNRALFNHIKSGKIIETSETTKNLGIATGVIYFLMYAYVYITAYVYMKKNKIPINWITTTSESFQYCEKRMTIVFLIVFLGLLQGLFNSQNLYGMDFKRVSIISVNYAIITCWLLFFYIVSPIGNRYSDRVNGIPHFLLALVVLLSVVYNSSTITELYKQYYTTESLHNIITVSNITVGFFSTLALLVFLHSAVSLRSVYYTFYTNLAIAFTELICLGLFGIFIIYFSLLPPLVDDNELTCTIGMSI